MSFSSFKTRSQARHAQTHSHSAVAIVDGLAVLNGHIGEHFIVQQRAGNHGKGHGDGLSILGIAGTHRIVKAQGDMAALACQVGGGNLRSVQGGRNLQLNRQRFTAVALIVDFIALGLPNAIRKGFIALDVLDLFR